MGFYAYAAIKAEIWQSNQTTMPLNKMPVFLLPGILGCGVYELAALVESLKKLNPDRTFYVYNDPIFEDLIRDGVPVNTAEATNDSVTSAATVNDLDSYARNILAEMRRCLPSGPMPYLLFGFSFGGALAAKIANILQTEGADMRVFIVDSPTREATQAYFAAQTPVIELLNIFFHLGNLIGFTLNTNLLSDQLDKLQKLPLDECIDEIANALELREDLSEHDRKAVFLQRDYLIEQVKQKLNYLLHDKSPELAVNNGEIKKITCLITRELEGKFGAAGGWQKYNVNYINKHDLANKTHLELIASATTDSLAAAITQKINDIHRIELAIHQLNSLAPLGVPLETLHEFRERILSHSPQPGSPSGNESADSDEECEKFSSQKASVVDTEDSETEESCEKPGEEKSKNPSVKRKRGRDNDSEHNYGGRLFCNQWNVNKKTHPKSSGFSASCPNLLKINH